MTTPSAEKVHAERILAAVFACREKDCPMPFALYRNKDVTGVSGSGTVAHGVQFADGTVVIRWLGGSPSTVVWGSLEAAMRVHGHEGSTRVVWLAAEFSEMGKAEEEAAAAERERILAAAESLKVTLTRPGNGPGQREETDVVPLAALRDLITGEAGQP